MDNTLTIGFLGTGHLASYVIEGFRNSGLENPIILSPRNAARADHLKKVFGCSVASSNQEVVDSSDIIMLSVRPGIAPTLLASLSIPSDKYVISCMAGINLEQLRSITDLPDTTSRMIPTVSAEMGEGFVPVYPDDTMTKTLADHLGQAVTFDDEDHFEISLSMSCLQGWLYEMMHQQQNWLIKQGLDAKSARDITLHNVRGATAYGLSRPEQSLHDLAGEIATEGTFTKLGLDELEKNGGLAGWTQSLDLVLQKLKNG